MRFARKFAKSFANGFARGFSGSSGSIYDILKKYYQWLPLGCDDDIVDKGTGDNDAVVISGTMAGKDIVLDTNPNNDVAIQAVLDSYSIPNPITYAQMKAIRTVAHEFVTETKPRVQNIDYESIFTGVTRTVGISGDFTTITAAYNASSSGDVIQLLDGTIISNLETNGYLLLNTTGKRILIQGNSNDNTACIIEQNAAALYTIRLRATGMVIFKDLTITSNQDNVTMYIDANFDDRNFVYDNCILDNESIGSSSRTFNIIGASLDYDRHIEFKNTKLKKTGNGGFLSFLTSQASTTQYLYDNCEIESVKDWGLIFNGTNSCDVAIYDSTLKQSTGNYVIAQFGEDTAIPAAQFGFIDIRNNTFAYENGYTQHALLLGRGTSKRCVINNVVTMPSVNSSVAIGIVDKTTSIDLLDSYLAGNYVEAPRPYYIKGARYNDVNKNTFICNETNWEAFGFTNYVNGGDEELSNNNRVIDNYLVGKKFCIHLYPSAGESVDVKTTAQTCDINNNYDYDEDKYLSDGVANIDFVNKDSYWQGNESDSVLIQENQTPSLNAPPKEDFTIDNSEDCIKNWAVQPYEPYKDVNGEQMKDVNGEDIHVIKDFS